MAAEHYMNIAAETRAYVKSFLSMELFGDTGKQFQRSWNVVLLHDFLQRQRRRHVHRLARVVAFTVTRRARNNWIVISDAWFLRSLRDIVDIGDECDYRLARTPGRHPRGWNPRN